MTFKSLFTYIGVENGSIYTFSAKPYMTSLFDTALGTKMFSSNAENIKLSISVADKPNTRAKLLVLCLSIDSICTIMLKEDNADPNKSYRAVALELLMLWLVFASNLRRAYSLEQTISMLNMNTFAAPQYFDMFAFRQLMTQEFADVSRFYVCNMQYLDSVITTNNANDVNLFRLAVTDTFTWLFRTGTNNVSDNDLWTYFVSTLKRMGIINILRLSKDDKQAILKFMRDKAFSFSTESPYPAKSNLLGTAFTNTQFKLWADFTVILARKILHPRVKTYSLQC